jgi:hypothetical protein
MTQQMLPLLLGFPLVLARALLRKARNLLAQQRENVRLLNAVVHVEMVGELLRLAQEAVERDTLCCEAAVRVLGLLVGTTGGRGGGQDKTLVRGQDVAEWVQLQACTRSHSPPRTRSSIVIVRLRPTDNDKRYDSVTGSSRAIQYSSLQSTQSRMCMFRITTAPPHLTVTTQLSRSVL